MVNDMTYPYYQIRDALCPTKAAPRFSGALASHFDRITRGLFCQIDFSKTVDMFRNTLDLFAAGEFWGKLMRAACIFYALTEDETLKDVICASMEDMLTVQSPDGEISCTPRASQPNGTHGSDLWERKYVLLGMEAYYRVFGDDRVLNAMCRLADYTCAQVGSRDEGKTPITETGWAFCGIESSSILEPVVRLYGLTGKAQYLALARHIVEETGACKRENIFDAILSGRSPYTVGGNGNPRESIAKAYEMMSCFEGLCEYYRATGDSRWRDCACRFFDALLEEEITLLGSGGADAPYNLGPGTGEQWNRTKYEQTNPDINLSQETCVTITWMKLCLQMLRLTGDLRCADEIERSLGNALLGALRPDGAYFDYFPTFNGQRGGKVNFTYNIGDMPLSCCTANGPAGLAALCDAAVLQSHDTTAVLLYLPGEYRTEHLHFTVTVCKDIQIERRIVITVLDAAEEEQSLSLRIPAWACGHSVSAPDSITTQPLSADHRALILRGMFSAGDTITLSLGRRLSVIAAPHGSNRTGDNFFALTFGASVMCRDLRFDADIDGILPLPDKDLPVSMCSLPDVTTALRTVIGGREITLVDYASAGATWDERSSYRSWFPCK